MIYNEDCVLTMSRLQNVDLVLTSPPYGTVRDYDGFKFDFEAVAKGIVSVLKDGGVLVWVVGDQVVKRSETGTPFSQALRFLDLGLRLHDTMIYEKTGIPFPESTRYNQCFEYMMVFVKGKIRFFNGIKDKPNVEADKKAYRPSGNRMKNGKLKPISPNDKDRTIKPFGLRTNIWKYKTGKGNTTRDSFAFEHPAMFPEALAHDHIVSWTNPGEFVYDPFGGAGTTCKIAKMLGREYAMSETSTRYCEIAKQRIEEGLT